VPDLNFAPLDNAITRLRRSTEAFNAQEQHANGSLPLAARKALDEIFMQCDRALLRPEGLPRRPWYRNQIYAPGYYTGYSPKTIPGVREAIEERRWEDAGAQIPIAASVLEAMADQIDRAAGILAGAGGK
jgi:N-acetylated-alpha-linked acidic dipeptidase